jgi:hypothetical protein
MPRPVNFYSEGIKLAGDLFLPGNLHAGEKAKRHRAVSRLYGRAEPLPFAIARVLTDAGYAVLTFDYKGWGDSEGPLNRLAPYSRAPAHMAFLGFP